MAVIATAGHVDHGKSTLVRALTGTDPDRLAEEKRRGLTLDLGFVWTDLPSGRVHVVDVPGHQKYVSTMLAGVGPLSAVLLVVAADGGWSAQTQEHAEVLAALGHTRCVVAVSRSDLADPAATAADTRNRLHRLGITPLAVVPTSTVTGVGLGPLRAAIEQLIGTMPDADETAGVRLWIDRAFSIRGAGTVVTGTLHHGAISVGDIVHIGTQRAVVRGLQSAGDPLDRASGSTRLAVNLRGIGAGDVHRGDLLTTTPAVHTPVAELEPLWPASTDSLPRYATAHVGTASIPIRVRRTGDGRIRISTNGFAVPWQIGDRVVVRDPSRHHVLLGGSVTHIEDPRSAPARRVAVPSDHASIQTPDEVHPSAIRDLADTLASSPMEAPAADWAEQHDVTPGQLAAAERDGLLLRVGGTILGPDALTAATTTLAAIDQPFSLGDAARALGTSRRVALAVLTRLDGTATTVKRSDGLRTLRSR